MVPPQPREPSEPADRRLRLAARLRARARERDRARATPRRCAPGSSTELIVARDAAVASRRRRWPAPTPAPGRWRRSSTTSRSTRPGAAPAPGRASRSSRRSTATSTPARSSSTASRSSSAIPSRDPRPAGAATTSASRSASAASTACRAAPATARCRGARRRRALPARPRGRERAALAQLAGRRSPPTSRAASRCRSGCWPSPRSPSPPLDLPRPVAAARRPGRASSRRSPARCRRRSGPKSTARPRDTSRPPPRRRVEPTSPSCRSSRPPRPQGLRPALKGSETVSLATLVVQWTDPELFQSARAELTDGFEPLIASIGKVIAENQDADRQRHRRRPHRQRPAAARATRSPPTRACREARAATIADILVANGVPADRVRSEGRAATEPVADEQDARGPRAQPARRDPDREEALRWSCFRVLWAFLTSRWLWTLIGLALLVAIIWIFGPLVGVGTAARRSPTRSCGSSSSRVLVLLWLVWLIVAPAPRDPRQPAVRLRARRARAEAARARPTRASPRSAPSSRRSWPS